MKFHTIVANEVFKKGLDPFYPHNELDADGLLKSPKQPSEQQSSSPSLPVEQLAVSNSVSDDVKEDKDDVELPQEVVQSIPEVVPVTPTVVAPVVSNNGKSFGGKYKK